MLIDGENGVFGRPRRRLIGAQHSVIRVVVEFVAIDCGPDQRDKARAGQKGGVGRGLGNAGHSSNSPFFSIVRVL